MRSDSLRRAPAEIEPLAWGGESAQVGPYENGVRRSRVPVCLLSITPRKRDAVNLRLERLKVCRGRSFVGPSWHLQDQLMTC
jgi:hypothetical protein